MVPFGPLAFMPGKLVHTNEILVLLGDNWFAERSAKQACEIIDRRIKSVSSEIHKLQQQKQLLQPRIDAVSKKMAQQSDIFEITEEYDEEKEKKWREEHKKNAQAYKRSLKDKPSENSKEKTDEELWERLNELERIESERRELQKITSDEVLLHKSYDSDDSIMSIESGSNSGDHDTNDLDNLEDSSDGGDSDDEGSERAGVTKHIRFSHTNSKKAHSIDADDSTDTDDVKIKTPADIYSQFYNVYGHKPNMQSEGTEKQVTVESSELESTSNEPEPEISKSVAFSGSVIERIPDDKSSNEKDAGSSANKPVRMSKFKARRQGLDQV